MKWKWFYLMLTFPGIIVPLRFLIGFLQEDLANIPLFFRYIFVNAASSVVAADLLLSALIFLLFVCVEGRRHAMRRLWLYPTVTLMMGLSFGLPLFLYFREKAMERQSGTAL